MVEQPYHRAGFAKALLEEKGINRLRFDQAGILLGEGAKLIDETGRTRLGGGLKVLTAQVTRAAHTFEAVLTNCMIGRGVQASMLNRSLFEDVLEIHWVAENLDSAAERADQHDRFMALAEHKINSDFDRTDRPLNQLESAELAKLIELYGGPSQAFKASWTRTAFAERFALLQSRWKDEPEARAYFEIIYEVIQRQNNLLLHSSPTGYRQTIFYGPEGRQTLNRAGPDGRWREALGHGGGAFYLAGRVLSEEFGFDKEPMAAAFSLSTDYLEAIDQLNGIQELDPGADCPCGSGRQVASCHLS